MSIDYYAGPGLGAASLLHCNADELWPEFSGQDLTTMYPGCELRRLAENGASIRQVQEVVLKLEPHDGPTLVTITVGGNDLLGGLGSRSWPMEDFERDLDQTLIKLRQIFPKLRLLVGNIYDPGEGKGVVQSGHDLFATQLARLPDLNHRIFEVAAAHGALCIDIHSHFKGHVIGSEEWIFCDIEPTKQGSSEIRRLWWEALKSQREHF